MRSTRRLTLLTFLAFVAWSAVEINHDKWDTILAAILWSFAAYNMGECHGMEWMRKTWKLPGGE